MFFFLAWWVALPSTIPTVHGGHHVEHTIIPNNIFTLFSEALEKF